MKKFIAYLISTILISVALWTIYKLNVLNNLENKDKKIQNQWIELVVATNLKDKLFADIIKESSNKIIKDSLNFYINNKEKININLYKSDNFKNWLINEYYIDKYSMLLTSNMKIIGNIKYEDELVSNCNKCNFLIEKYNITTQDYNIYRGSFPHFFIAKKSKFFSINFIKLKYGGVNKDPTKKTNIDKWIETGNDKYLNIEN
jgi:hypothetical protein